MKRPRPSPGRRRDATRRGSDSGGPERLEDALFPPEPPKVIVLPPSDELSKSGSRRIPLSRLAINSGRRRLGTAVALALVPLAGLLAPAAAHADTASTGAHALYFAPAKGTSITPAYG